VWRGAAGYGVVGWLIIQFATTVFPALTLPVWTARLVIILVLAGLPIALILAWAFDVTSAGIEKTPDVTRAFSRCPRNSGANPSCSDLVALPRTNRRNASRRILSQNGGGL